jgi:P27 family predicted phage terminase small subunit
MEKNIPKPPKHLSADARRWWQEIQAEYRIVDPGGRLLLQTAMEAFDRMRQSQTIISEQGATLKDRFDQVKSHPQLTIERDARSQMIQSLKALALDPEQL